MLALPEKRLPHYSPRPCANQANRCREDRTGSVTGTSARQSAHRAPRATRYGHHFQQNAADALATLSKLLVECDVAGRPYSTSYCPSVDTNCSTGVIDNTV